MSSQFKDKQVFKFIEDRWEEVHILNAAKENLVAVSVPEEYICYGKQPIKTASVTTTGSMIFISLHRLNM